MELSVGWCQEELASMKVGFLIADLPNNQTTARSALIWSSLGLALGSHQHIMCNIELQFSQFVSSTKALVAHAVGLLRSVLLLEAHLCHLPGENLEQGRVSACPHSPPGSRWDSVLPRLCSLILERDPRRPDVHKLSLLGWRLPARNPWPLLSFLSVQSRGQLVKVIGGGPLC